MGGMTILAMARQFPELFDDRVIGVGLLATTAAGLNKSGLGRNLNNPVIDAFRPRGADRARRRAAGPGAARAIISPILRAASYGTEVSPRLVEFSDGMLSDVSVVTVVNFLESLELHDESRPCRCWATFRRWSCADADMIIPFSSSKALAAGLSRAELVRVRDAGHLVELEFPQVTSDAIDRLVRARVSRREDRENAALVGWTGANRCRLTREPDVARRPCRRTRTPRRSDARWRQTWGRATWSCSTVRSAPARPR